MKKLPLSILSALALASATQAQTTVSSAPVGFNSVTCKAGSDTFVSVPFCQQMYQGVLSSASNGTTAGQGVLVVQGAPAWTSDQYAGLYYAKILSGSKAGRYFTILHNDANSLTVDLAGESVSGFANTDSLRICKYWTLGTLLPAASQTTAVPSTGNLAFQRRTELLFPDLTTADINLAPNRVFYVVNTQEWREATNGFANADNAIIAPDSYFIVRHGNAAIVSDTTFTSTGGVDMSADASGLAPFSTYLGFNSGGGQDNAVVTGSPVPVALKNLNLVASGAFTASTGNLAFQRGDEIYTYDNSAVAINKSAAHIYFYVSSVPEWREATNGFANADNATIDPSSGFFIRKHVNASNGSVVWTMNQ